MRRALSLLVLAGCAGTEVGNPPFSPEEPDPGYRQDAADVDPSATDTLDGLVFAIPTSDVNEGRVDSSMTIVNLDRNSPTLTLDTVGDTDSAIVSALPGEVLRAQLIVPEGRKTPVDYHVVTVDEIALHVPELD